MSPGLSLALLGLTLSQSAPRYALLVGHNLGDLRETPLRWAQSDAQRMKAVLNEIGEVTPERTTLLKSPNLDALKTAFAQMEGRLLESKARGERPVFIFYFSGHADRENLHLAREVVEIEALERALKGTAATTVLAIIDACRNDRTPRVQSKGAHRAPSFAWPQRTSETPQGHVFLSSAAEGEVAQESDDLQGSLFTHHLLSGMRGSADVDEDGTVTLDELYRYGYSRTLEDTHGSATAVQHSEQTIDLSGRGELIVTYPRRAAAQVRFAPAIRGHLLLIDDTSGRIVAEVYQRAERPAKLAVPPGRYRVQLRHEDGVRSGLIALNEGIRTLQLTELKASPSLAVLTKGAAYDPHPFMLFAGANVGRSRVQGFGASAGARLGLDYRLSVSWRLELSADLGYAQGESELWERNQLETNLLAGADWVAIARGGFALTLGLRGGAAIVFQRSERKEQARLQAAQVNDDLIFQRKTAVGPLLALNAGLEYYPGSRFGFRLSAEPSAAWVPSNEAGLRLRWGATGALSLVVRL